MKTIIKFKSGPDFSAVKQVVVSTNRASAYMAGLLAGGAREVQVAGNVRPEPKRALYSFNFAGGGVNAVWAFDKAEAIRNAKREFPGMSVNPKTFVRRASKKSQDAYWNDLPLMD